MWICLFCFSSRETSRCVRAMRKQRAAVWWRLINEPQLKRLRGKKTGFVHSYYFTRIILQLFCVVSRTRAAAIGREIHPNTKVMSRQMFCSSSSSYQCHERSWSPGPAVTRWGRVFTLTTIHTDIHTLSFQLTSFLISPCSVYMEAGELRTEERWDGTNKWMNLVG